MEKLKELIDFENAYADWGHSSGWAKSYGSKISPKSIKKSKDYDNYKGYRFFTENISSGILLISMVLSDRPFIVGNIKLEETGIDELNIFGLDMVYMVKMSQLHDRFKGKGLGYLLYEYVIKKYGVLLSDDTLFAGSYKLWVKTLPKYLSGPIFAIYNYKSLPSIQLITNINEINNISHFIAFSSRKKVDEKIYKACNYIKNNTKDFTEVKWLVGITGKTDTLKGIKNKNYDGLFKYNYNPSGDILLENKKIIIIGKNYCILVYKDNNKIKVIDF